jgi:anaerobic dimethyl sulfoxide reductase subunit B (iron-sulfur subunit)
MSGAGFTLDLGRCVGCGACVLACRLENRWPDGVSWRRVLTLNLSRYPGGPTYHFSVACHHCEHPACLKACPSGACEKHPDGTALINSQRCLGCRYCEMACPFGAPSYDNTGGVMTKCDLCTSRRDRGLAPACVAACPTGALDLSKAGEEKYIQQVSIPGFSDPTGCGPSIRFKLPHNRIRSQRLRKIQEAMRK